ncbi:GNAT family N-acetyltransferase [Saccharopolyspora pogona]|uniref:GNAT family N-acetyltransferase n=1 Tax=Saccharopolyspora pogona TaxID=333966 RepID=UPI001CC25A31
MGSGVLVRRVIDSELNALREARLRALAADPDAFGSTLDREWAESMEFWRERLARGPWFLAWSGRAAVGVVAAVPARTSGEHQLEAMWVAPEWRRKGVAEALVDAVLSSSRTNGATSVTRASSTRTLLPGASTSASDSAGRDSGSPTPGSGRSGNACGSTCHREVIRGGRAPTIEKEHDFRDADSTGVMVISPVLPRTLRVCLGPVWTRTPARSPRCSTASREGTT